MAEYICREVAVEKITFLCELREIVCNPDDEFLRGLKTALNAIKSNETIPSAEDVQPVRHGYWSECYTDSHHYSGVCSVCGGGAIRKVKGKPLDYCPKCGARMDGDAE